MCVNVTIPTPTFGLLYIEQWALKTELCLFLCVVADYDTYLTHGRGFLHTQFQIILNLSCTEMYGEMQKTCCWMIFQLHFCPLQLLALRFYNYNFFTKGLSIMGWHLIWQNHHLSSLLKNKWDTLCFVATHKTMD